MSYFKIYTTKTEEYIGQRYDYGDAVKATRELSVFFGTGLTLFYETVWSGYLVDVRVYRTY